MAMEFSRYNNKSIKGESVLAIENRALGLSSTTVGQLTYLYISLSSIRADSTDFHDTHLLHPPLEGLLNYRVER